MDQIDLRILTALQRDATIPIAQLADRVGLSQTPCWKRVQKLEQAGVITGRVACVDPLKVGLTLTVFVELVALDHTSEWRAGFVATVEAIPEVMEVLRLGGESDYLLRVVVGDMQSYDSIYRRLTDAVRFRSVTSKFVMETVHRKDVLAIPADKVSGGTG